VGFFFGFQKIALKKDKLKFSPKFDQESFARYVKKKADHIGKTGYAEGKPKDFEWCYEPKMSLDFAKKIRTDWGAWFEQERQEWVYNHGPAERANHFDKWSESPECKPIIVVKGTDGKPHIWDGHHRIAKALSLGMKTIPAIVGVRKK
jgi:hypothetical protein